MPINILSVGSPKISLGRIVQLTRPDCCWVVNGGWVGHECKPAFKTVVHQNQ